MKAKNCIFAFVPLFGLILVFDCPAQDPLSRVTKQQKSNIAAIALRLSKREQNPLQRVISSIVPTDPNAHATGFLVGEGLVMTSYHVVSGKLSAHKKTILGFKPEDELHVRVYVNGREATIIKTDEAADLALLKAHSTKPVQRPTFRSAPGKDEKLLLIAQPGSRIFVREASYNGPYFFRGTDYWSLRVEGQDGFSGSPVYDSNGEIVGVYSLYDWLRRVALIIPALKAQQFLADYYASQHPQPPKAAVEPSGRAAGATLRECVRDQALHAYYGVRAIPASIGRGKLQSWLIRGICLRGNPEASSPTAPGYEWGTAECAGQRSCRCG